MPDPTPTTRRDTTHESAYRRGLESAAIARGDTHRQRNPYEPRSDRWLAYARGWDAWTLQALQSGRRFYEAPAIVYEGTLTARAGSRPCVAPEHGCYDIDPEKLFGG